jgi:hypothetical protein
LELLIDEVIEPKKLPPKTTLYLETNAQVFEFILRLDGRLWATCAGKRSFTRQTAEFVGSLTQKGMLFADKIVRNQHLVIRLESGRYTTGCVKSASVHGDGYFYELWQD